MVFEFGSMEGRGSRGKWKVLEIGGMMEVRDMEQKKMSHLFSIDHVIHVKEYV